MSMRTDSSSTIRVFLADLGHNQLTLSSDVYPLGIANLAMYLRSHFECPEDMDVRIFQEPDDLMKASIAY